MPFKNKPCDKCGKKDKPVYERYTAISGDSMPIKRCPYSGELIPSNIQYWCNDCNKEPNESDI